MTEFSIDDLIEKTIDIVKQASAFATLDNVSIQSKGTVENIVTSADIEVQKFLEKELTALLPQSGFFGEESDPSHAERELCWIVDPIDGTQNFSRGLNQSAISVALRCANDVVLGVVFNPFLNELFYAGKSTGAFLNGKRICVSSKPFRDGIFCTAIACYHKEKAEICGKIILDAYKLCNDVRRFGVCSLELCYLASGRADLYYEYVLCPWDYAAASLILEEAGGAISTLDGKVSLSEPCCVVAANSEENLEVLREIAKRYMDI